MVIDTSALFLTALLLLTLPLNWLLAAITAAAVHELCHCLAARALGGRIRSFRIGVGGAVLEVDGLSVAGEAAAALAGPAGGLALTLLCSRFPRLALCALVQSLFNLIPIYPLDGGRLLQCLLRWRFPGSWQRWQLVTRGILLPFGMVALWLVCRGGLLLPVALILLLRPFQEKFLALRRISRYNRERYSEKEV